MRHITHDKGIMKEVQRRCLAKFPLREADEIEWNLMYDAVLCDNILTTLDWKLAHLTIGTKL